MTAAVDLLVEVKEEPPAPNAIWRSAGGDIPVHVNGHLGNGPDGREYVSVEGSTSGVPLDEIDDTEEGDY